ncbi:hypothetical protein [Marinoscillum sp.]
MTDTTKDNRELDTPPYFKSWRSIYWLVAGFLLLIIVMLYFFSQAY